MAMLNQVQAIKNLELLESFSLFFLILLISFLLRFEFRLILTAGLRMVIQLLLVGFWIRYLLLDENWIMIGAYLFIMILISAQTVRARIKESDFSFAKIFAVLFLVLSFILAFGLSLIPGEIRLARFLVPLAGIILGNTLSALSLGIETGLEESRDNESGILNLYGLGASPFRAFYPVMEKSLKRALTPITNTMKVAGLVALPGLFTGQVLAGVDPFEAAIFQIFVLILVFASVYLGTLISVFVLYHSYRRLSFADFGSLQEKIDYRH